MITVLLIDDDEDEFILFSEALQKLDKSFNCVHANSAASGLEILLKFVPRYIYLDIYMPITTGLECIPLIRKLTAHKTTPIVLYSAFISRSDWKNAKQSGADGYFKKTGSLGVLVENLLAFFLKFNRQLFLKPR